MRSAFHTKNQTVIAPPERGATGVARFTTAAGLVTRQSLAARYLR